MSDDLGKMPTAIKSENRWADVELLDKSKVRVEKWSWMKYQDLYLKVGYLKHAMEIATLSVAEADRERLKSMDPEDVMAIAAAAIKLNMTEGFKKNLGGLLGVMKEYGEAAEEKQ